MILFDVNEKGYTVEWTDLPYEVLYIVYYPVGARIMIENGRIVVLSKGFAYPSIVSPKKFGAITDRHAANIPSGTYSVRLCTDQKGAGGGCEILAEKTLYLGRKVAVRYMIQADRNDDRFAWMLLSSDCYIPPDHIWITYRIPVKGMEGKADADARIFLPEMRSDVYRHFSTQCLIPKSGYRYLTVLVSEDIRGCVQIIRC